MARCFASQRLNGIMRLCFRNGTTVSMASTSVQTGCRVISQSAYRGACFTCRTSRGFSNVLTLPAGVFLSARPIVRRSSERQAASSVVFKRAGYSLNVNVLTINKIKKRFKFSLSRPYERKGQGTRRQVQPSWRIFHRHGARQATCHPREDTQWCIRRH